MIKIDAKNQTLGRLASKLALILRGKNNPKFQPNILPKNKVIKVIVFNSDKIKLTGKKLKQKKYYSYSGYPGGIKEKSLKEIFEKDSRIVLRKAVFGMLPKNRLREKIIKNLIIYKNEIEK